MHTFELADSGKYLYELSASVMDLEANGRLVFCELQHHLIVFLSDSACIGISDVTRNGASIVMSRNRSMRLSMIVEDISQDISSTNLPSLIPSWSEYRKDLTNALVWVSRLVGFIILFEKVFKVAFIR